ncbi:hypothetical protein C0993_000405, partial [Termitomyces sp. T159_Od127]
SPTSLALQFGATSWIALPRLRQVSRPLWLAQQSVSKQTMPWVILEFKIWEWSPSFSSSTGLVFDSENIWQFNFTIPKNTPNGQYLLRGEQIALHVASTVGGAQA